MAVSWSGSSPDVQRRYLLDTAESCTASRYGNHDYSRPPHNTQDSPRDSEGEDDPCQAGLDDCEDERRYEVVVYQAGTHEWIRLRACVPCTASLREFHERLGPGGSQGIASVRTATTREVVRCDDC